MEPTSKDKENVVNPDANLSKRTESPNKDGEDVSKKRPRNHNHNNDNSNSTQPADASATLPASVATTTSERVPFGTFSRGNQIYRNRIVTDGDDAAKETQSEGFYSIEELVLPHCTAALCTSFTASRNAVSWFQRVFHGIPQLTVMVPGPVDIGHAMVTPMMNMEVEIPIVGEEIKTSASTSEKNEAAAAVATATTTNNKRFVPVPHWYFHNNGKSTKANNEPEKRDKEGTKKSLTNSKSATATANATKKDKRKESRLPTTSTATTPSSDENKKTFLPIPQWYWVSARPENTGGCLHAKVLLFRSPQGLRVIVAGCNLSRRQWETARDVFWVQDFPLIVNDKTAAASWGYDPYDPRGFKDKLETFLQQVMKCDEEEAKQPNSNSKTSTSNTATKTRQTKQHKLISRRITSILEGIDFSKARALLVVSFPRRVEKNTQGVRVKDVYRHHKYGGWKQLALAVHQALLDQGMLADDDSSNSSCCSDDDNHRKRKPVTYAAADRRLYVTSGSLGNLEPGFIWQMHQAMNGEQVEPQQQQQWKDVEDHFRCFWPSARTSKTMDVLGLMGALRPMPRRHVQSIPSTSRQKMLHDAIPNPNTKSKTAFQRYHNKLLKMSSSASTTTAKKNDNSQPHPPTLAFAPVTHGKFMYNRRGVLYVGSHNFSRSAWGERNAQPKNVEVGVVLATPRQAEQEAWIRRLPCHVDVDTDPPKLSSNYEPFVGRWTIQHHCHPLAYLLPPERQEKNDGNDDDDDDSGDESSVGAFMDDFY